MLLSLEFYEKNHKATYYESNYELELQGNEGENIGTKRTFNQVEEHTYAMLCYAINLYKDNRI